MEHNMKLESAQARVPATMPEKFLWFTAILADKNLSTSAKNVAGRLMLHHNDRTGQCNPSHRRLATGLGLSEKHGRKTVCRLVGELKAGGWIEATETAGASEYRLLLDRAATVADGSADELEAPDPRQGVSLNCDRGVSLDGDRGVPDLRQGVSLDGDTEPSREPSRETVNLNPEPAAVAIEPAVRGPAEVSVMPAQPATILLVPANDDGVDGGMTISGWEIPGSTIRQWKAGFKYIDLDAELTRSGPWFVANVPAGRRLSALASRLHKVNEANRIESVTRRENREADADAGVERCWTNGRIKSKGDGIPPGANPRYYMK